MRPQRIATWVLLIFVAATVGKLVFDAVAADPAAEARADNATADGVIAYFLHTDVRCWNCNTIEKFAHESLSEDFAEELASGAIEWRVLNMDKPANDHLATDFELVTSSVVLARMENGARTDWKNLSRVWDLVHDEEEFKAYIEERTSAFLEEQP